jgi:hypothetical protein
MEQQAQLRDGKLTKFIAIVLIIGRFYFILSMAVT